MVLEVAGDEGAMVKIVNGTSQEVAPLYKGQIALI